MKTFSFNLIPKKDKSVVVKEAKRDKMSIYTAFLPLVAVVIWLLLVLFNGFVVAPSRTDWQESVTNKQERIDVEFHDIRVQHGELVIKTKILGDLITKDIKPETLFILTERIFPVTELDIKIVGYGRKDDGSFDVNLEVGSYARFAEVTRRFSDYQGAQDVTISSVSYLAESEVYSGTINCYLDVEYIKNDV